MDYSGRMVVVWVLLIEEVGSKTKLIKELN